MADIVWPDGCAISKPLIREWSPAGRASAADGVLCRRLPGRDGSDGGVQGDLVSEGFEFGDEAAGFAFGVQAAVEVVGAEFLVGGAGGQDVPDDDEDGVGDDDDGLVLRGDVAVAAGTSL
jgi:hypothetical protein